MGRFWRMTEAFEVARKVRDCESSGSEHSPETMMDLSDMVNSFIENGNGVVNIDFDMQVDDESSSDGTDDDMEEIKESLRRLIENGDDVKRNLISKVEKANNDVVDDNRSSQSLGFKRRLMACLRDRGLDAGLCKSKWEKKGGRLLAGNHEYIDVNVKQTRYIIIVSLLEEFEIARPTAGYASLLEILPGISVFKVEDFKEMVKIMSKAIKRSMKQKKMPVPPWRRREYVQAKWFGSYKRTTNEYPTKKTPDRIVINNQSIGFISIPDHTCYGRRQDQFARKDFGYKMGNLAMVMNGAS
ncbi:hypothetical protein HanHA300_Chr16g0615751 [Helianthus annuus]|nr:hypothetical protein HanHA300_Chr16g0615751 [Helianthus annuus]KAJ0460930.1 hypothetical protein HanHA89_Chr16g0666541 [Helianthus annuus]KAJ0641361.1 hypothetical protein HanLR1_Chr16g0626311 [Helianthus annuus]KAJ0645258.1 hypothetical protein HanOQP8_Chr16g0621841 [Helianthus annuus]